MNKKLVKLNNKKVAILGLGIENSYLISYLLRHKVKCEITVCDFRSKKQLGAKYDSLDGRVSWKLGAEFNHDLHEFDCLFRSPGWILRCPGIKEACAVNKSVVVTSPIRYFFELSPTRNIIGVTGTKGKGTTSSLIYSIIKKSGKRVFLGGNIGIAPFSFIDELAPNDWVVLELSSFHLEDMNVSPKIAVFTNFFKEHLSPADPNNPNFHGSLAEYWRAKFNIMKWQKKTDKAVINKKLSHKVLKEKPKSKVVFFGKSNLSSKIIGEHNKENIDAAIKVAEIIGIKDEIINGAVAEFSGLEYRLEFIGKKNDIAFYNDSFATTPESTITALKSFNDKVILIAGGADKGVTFEKLAKEISKKVKSLILLEGDGTPKIENELYKIGHTKVGVSFVSSMVQAVETAYSVARSGDTILLSPATASFGMFKNYKERGRLFNREFNKIK